MWMISYKHRTMKVADDDSEMWGDWYELTVVANGSPYRYWELHNNTFEECIILCGYELTPEENPSRAKR